MPEVPPNELNDLPKKLRARAKDLLNERSLLQYAFSYKKLSDMLFALNAEGQDEEKFTAVLRECVVAWNEEELKEAKSKLNNAITRIYTENGITQTLRDTDPFGRVKDYIMMQGTSTSFSQARAMPIIVAGIFEWVCPNCGGTNYSTSNKDVACMLKACERKDLKGKTINGIVRAQPKIKAKHSMPVEAVQAAFAAATVHTPYVSLQARDVKEKKGD